MVTTMPHTEGIGRFAPDKCWDFKKGNSDKVAKVLMNMDQEECIKYRMGDIVDRREEGRRI